MLRLWNGLIKMDDLRLTKAIFLWDLEQAGNTWGGMLNPYLMILI